MKKSEIHSFIREKMLTIFAEIPRSERDKKYVYLVDLVKIFPTSIYLQKSGSIQTRTSLSKFGGKFNLSFIRLLSWHRPGPGWGTVRFYLVVRGMVCEAEGAQRQNRDDLRYRFEKVR